MTEALATRKRKLYKILDSFSCPPRITTGAGHPSPLIPSSRFVTAPESVKAITNEGVRQPRRVASLAKMAEYRSRLGMGSGDRRTTSTGLKASSTILHKTGSSASLRNKNKEMANGQLHDGSPVTKRGTPAFCPWSHEEFLERLKTFAPVTTWLPKPHEDVSEVAWAKRGWSCAGIETVSCGVCRNRLVVDFSPPRQGREKKRRKAVLSDEDDGAERTASIPMLDADAQAENEEEDYEMNDADDNDYNYEEAFEKSLVEKYSALVVDGHSATCSWRQLGCKDNIYHLPVVQRDWWQKHILESFNAALDMADDIEKLNLHNVEASPAAEKILRDLPTKFFDKPAPPEQLMEKPSTPQRPHTSHKPQTPQKPQTPVAGLEKPSMPLAITISVTAPEPPAPSSLHTRALTIALTGWTPTTESSNNLLYCGACFQRVGLWLYHTPPTTTSPLPTSPADQDLDLDDAPASLDLILAHREHCPFRNAASQASTSSFSNQPAWSILWQTLARYADESRRRSNTATEVASPTSATFSPTHAAFGTRISSGATHEDVAQADKERSNKLKRLRKVLGIFKKNDGQAQAGKAQ